MHHISHCMSKADVIAYVLSFNPHGNSQHHYTKRMITYDDR